MTTTLEQKEVRLIISCILALGLVSTVANASEKQFASEYVTDNFQNVFTTDYGECWHTGAELPAVENSVPCKPSFAAFEVVDSKAPEPIVEPMAVTFGIDTKFDFDKSELRPSVRLVLDTFVRKLNDIYPETITVTGHADRLGTDSYNQHLSEQRAQAVKNYMVSMGVPAESIIVSGKGETQPITKAGDCDDSKADELHFCLQTDRRVEAQVVGTYKENASQVTP
ncbi:MAG: OmpA family protein [Candidatus Thiodiazotropha sp.]